VRISNDPRAAALSERGLDFEDAAGVIAGGTLDLADYRFGCGETLTVTIGHLRGRLVVVVWTQRRAARHDISMRKANDREQARFGRQFEHD
jgi:uncharacterized DUF497 family protein